MIGFSVLVQLQPWIPSALESLTDKQEEMFYSMFTICSKILCMDST